MRNFSNCTTTRGGCVLTQVVAFSQMHASDDEEAADQGECLGIPSNKIQGGSAMHPVDSRVLPFSLMQEAEFITSSLILDE